jgi:hypothetical protein
MEGDAQLGTGPSPGVPTPEAVPTTTTPTTATGSYAEATSPRSASRTDPSTPPPESSVAERFKAGIALQHVFFSCSIPTDAVPTNKEKEEIVKQILKVCTAALSAEGFVFDDNRFPGVFHWLNAVKFFERSFRAAKFMLRVSMSDAAHAAVVERALAAFEVPAQSGRPKFFFGFSRMRVKEAAVPPPEPTHQVVLWPMPVTAVTPEEICGLVNELKLEGFTAKSAQWHNNNNNNNNNSNPVLALGSQHLRVTLAGAAPKSLAECRREFQILPDVTVNVSQLNPRLRAEELKEHATRQQQRKQQAGASPDAPTALHNNNNKGTGVNPRKGPGPDGYTPVRNKGQKKGDKPATPPPPPPPPPPTNATTTITTTEPADNSREEEEKGEAVVELEEGTEGEGNQSSNNNNNGSGSPQPPSTPKGTGPTAPPATRKKRTREDLGSTGETPPPDKGKGARVLSDVLSVSAMQSADVSGNGSRAGQPEIDAAANQKVGGEMKLPGEEEAKRMLEDRHRLMAEATEQRGTSYGARARE